MFWDGFRVHGRRKTVSVLTMLKSVARKLPIIGRVIAERDALRRACGFVPPGHYFPPLPAWEEIRQEQATIFGKTPRTIPGIDLRETEQLELLESFVPYYETMPFKPHKSEGLRYHFENGAYSYSDAICLHCMIRHAKPKRIVEIGSGYSSCVTLDTNEVFFKDSIELTFIEPYPDLLLSLLEESDKNKVRIIPHRLQTVGLELFGELEANDIVFVDSTHVSKIDSDVTRIFFDILPALSPGVYVHFHDAFFPFEYPKEWIFEGRAWNELYLLRAFLQYNSEFRVVLMNTLMERLHEDFFREKMPLCLKNPGGSIWIQKTASADGARGNADRSS